MQDAPAWTVLDDTENVDPFLYVGCICICMCVLCALISYVYICRPPKSRETFTHPCMCLCVYVGYVNGFVYYTCMHVQEKLSVGLCAYSIYIYMYIYIYIYIYTYAHTQIHKVCMLLFVCCMGYVNIGFMSLYIRTCIHMHTCMQHPYKQTTCMHTCILYIPAQTHLHWITELHACKPLGHGIS